MQRSITTSASEQQRVLIVSPQPFYEDRGTPIAVRQLLLALTSLGYTTDLLAYPIGSSPEISGVRYHRCANPLGYRSVPVGFPIRKLVLDVALICSLIKLVRHEDYAAIHAVEEGAYPAALAARWLGVPLIYDMASSLPEQLTRHWLLGARPVQRALRACERWLLRRSEQVVASAGLGSKVAALAPGASVREWAFCGEARQCLSSEEVGAIRADLGVAAGKRIVLYTGTFAEYQGVDVLLGAAAAICASRSDVAFIVVGGYAAEQQNVRRGVARLSLERHVQVLGRRSREQTSRLLQIADIVVSPRSFGANIPLKIFDYLEAGRPIVATDIPAHRRVLDEQCAVFTPPDAAGLAHGIEQVLNDSARAAALAAAAAAVAAERYGWLAFVRLVSSIYADALSAAAPAESAVFADAQAPGSTLVAGYGGNQLIHAPHGSGLRTRRPR